MLLMRCVSWCARLGQCRPCSLLSCFRPWLVVQVCALLNKKSAIRTSRAGEKQREWREAHGQGTGDSYMANYCRQWWARKRAEREQHEEMD